MSDPETPSSRTTASRAALERRWAPWRPRTTAQLLDHLAHEWPDRPLVVTDARTWTYADVADLSTRYAAGLAALGVGPGDHVAVVMANFPEAVALKFAVTRLGAVSVSVNFMLRHEELGYVLEQSRASLLVTMDRFRDLDYGDELDQLVPGWERDGGGSRLPDLRDVLVFPTVPGTTPRGRALDDLVALGSATPDGAVAAATAAVSPTGVSDLLYTSGTTGKAKGVMLTHEGVLRCAYASAYTRALDDGYRILYAMPLYHVFGYVEATIAVMFVGGATVPRTTFDAVDALHGVEVHRADEIMCVPAMTGLLLDEAARRPYDLSSMTTLFSSGAAHRPEVWERMFAVLGVQRVFTAYGQTETTASTTCTAPDDSVDHLRGTNGAIKPAGAAGDPALGGAVAVYRVVDPVTGDDVPAGTVGELLARGPIVTQGYYAKPEETAALFTADGWMRTGDLGRVDELGYLTLTGRRKESYRFGGELVIPSEVEEVLLTHPGVLEAHVVGVPHERWGEIGCAWVVPDGRATPAAEELILHCRARLARFKVPAAVHFVEARELPRTVTGRVQKFQLVDRAIALAASDLDAVPR